MLELKKAKYLGGMGAILSLVGLVGLILFVLDKAFGFISVTFTFIYPCFLISFIFGFVSLFWAVKQLSNICRERNIFHNIVFATLMSVSGTIIAIIGTGWGLVSGFTIIGLFLFLTASIYLLKTLKEIGKATRKKIFLWSANIFLLSGILLVLMPLFLPFLGMMEEKLTGLLLLSVRFISFLLFPLFGPPLLWTSGFLLLAIAFFTLPENLPQKSLTEKKEV